MISVEIIAGSTSDGDLVKVIEETLDIFKVNHRSHVASAHRSPEKVKAIVTSCGADVFIGVAGLSAALPGVIASHTIKPVIGVPKDVKLEGLDAYLSISQMPPGVPVAAVGIDNAKNAAILAIEILALNDEDLRERLEAFRAKKA